MSDTVKPGSLWKHTKGNTYTVLAITNVDSTDERYPQTVVYCGTDGRLWSRPLSDWHRSMTKIEV